MSIQTRTGRVTGQRPSPASIFTEPDECVVHEFHHRGSGDQRPGEVRLCEAILEDAIDVLRWRQLVRLEPKQRREVQAAEDWLAIDDHEWPFSFVNVCHALGLDADATRKRMQAGTVARLRRPGVLVRTSAPERLGMSGYEPHSPWRGLRAG